MRPSIIRKDAAHLAVASNLPALDGVTYAVTKGLLDEFGPERVRDKLRTLDDWAAYVRSRAPS
jgi:hypothetical protein